MLPVVQYLGLLGSFYQSQKSKTYTAAFVSVITIIVPTVTPGEINQAPLIDSLKYNHGRFMQRY